MTEPNPNQLASMRLLGASIDRIFKARCADLGVEFEAAMAAPLEALARAERAGGDVSQAIYNRVLNLWHLGVKRPEIMKLLGIDQWDVEGTLRLARANNDRRAHWRNIRYNSPEKTMPIDRRELRRLRAVVAPKVAAELARRETVDARQPSP